MTKQPRLKTIDKDRKLSKTQFDKYLSHLVNKEPNCQICHSKAVEAHHLIFGAYKDDKTIISVCRECHQWCHANKHESIEKFMHIAQENWKAYAN